MASDLYSKGRGGRATKAGRYTKPDPAALDEEAKRPQSVADLSDSQLILAGRQAGHQAFRAAIKAGVSVPVMDDKDVVFLQQVRTRSDRST